MKKYIKYLIIPAIIIIAILLWSHFRKAKLAPEWRLDSPSQGSVREVVTATGSLNPYVLVNVGTEVSGKIEKLYKDYNDPVRKGELLAKLDTEILATSLEAARGDLAKNQTALEEAELDYNLQNELFEQHMSPEYDLKKARFKMQNAQQNLANARLSLQRAEKNLANAHITSPIDGVIVSRAVDEGQTVAASLNSPTLFIIANNLDKMQITAGVDEADIGKISLGMPVEFTVDAHPNQRFEGSVQQIRLNPTNESNVVTYNVIIDASNPQNKLLPGMTTNVTFIINSRQGVLRIPESATRFRPSKEIWELFGLKWNDELLNAGRKAMEAASKQPPEKPSDSEAIVAGPKQSKRQDSPGASAAKSPERMGVVWLLKDNEPKPVVVKTGVSDGAFVELIEGVGDDARLVTGVIYNDAKQANSNSAPGMRRF
ncbi:MAG: efflux RND transporter periplasmic adaptor subunit [Candidatus Cloacimonadaceae bacterium]|jgi:HlyD family secretion protein|nr:efflux RND transporter periplasmic adaptor subunit [Candidatus Cloacimonadota bacterium]MDY0380664.1 efflux RND transporter periplasmic adaptor subunit [Candidatus Cloacimonadaceae bacterium]MCK9433241.1 efflux RND transporter periplasmic adaptor subunit [Candidatus Cloacimonadota bacterium]MDD2616353.1 efflux RND transporter periplasmic adaptor subunit [Candidatus Cloacimonadota bacterium]MDD2719107.1 efflux RND transporter periplasmic adaptor subunit [Candidatus Cloacimonadota bacterium]